MTDEPQDRMNYDKSGMPKEQGGPSRETPPPVTGPVAVNPGSKDCVGYPSMRGSEIVELPLFEGERDSSPFRIESVKLKDVPGLIVDRVEEALSRTGDDEAVEVMRHYAGCLRGAGIVDERTADQIDELTRRFGRATDKTDFFTETLVPYLDGMRSAKKG